MGEERPGERRHTLDETTIAAPRPPSPAAAALISEFARVCARLEEKYQRRIVDPTPRVAYRIFAHLIAQREKVALFDDPRAIRDAFAELVDTAGH